MTTEKRIKLAEAVFYGHICVNGKLREDFDPWHSADDDYAVLERMRRLSDDDRRKHAFWNELRWRYAYEYQIGDYANAALKVIDER